MSEEDPRDELRRRAREARQQASRESHEATFTQRILRRLAPRLNIPQALKRQDKQVLSLEILPTLLNNLPLRLAAEQVCFLDEISASDLLGGKLPHTSLWRAFVAAVESRGIDLRKTYFGLITPWVGSSAVVLHNWPRREETLDRHKSYGRFVLVSSKHNTVPMQYSLEPLDALLDELERIGVEPKDPEHA